VERQGGVGAGLRAAAQRTHLDRMRGGAAVRINFHGGGAAVYGSKPSPSWPVHAAFARFIYRASGSTGAFNISGAMRGSTRQHLYAAPLRAFCAGRRQAANAAGIGVLPPRAVRRRAGNGVLRRVSAACLRPAVYLRCYCPLVALARQRCLCASIRAPWHAYAAAGAAYQARHVLLSISAGHGSARIAL